MVNVGSMVILLLTIPAGEAGPTFSVEGGVRQLIVVSALRAAADAYVLGDFESGAAPRWYVYEEPKGVMQVGPAPDAAVGAGAVRVTYAREGRWGYWDRPVEPARAAACNAVTFWIRGDGSGVAVVPRIRTPEGESRADPVVLSETAWRKVSIRLAHFYPRRSSAALAGIDLFRLTRLGVPKPFFFDVDQVQFEALPEVELDPPRIFDPSPAPGSVVTDASAVIGAQWADEDPGIDLSSAVIRVNTYDVTGQC